MEETQKTSLAIASTDLSVNLFRKDVTGTQKITSLDMNDEEQQDMYLKSKTNVEYLKDHVGDTITCVGCVITERLVEDFNEDTGEQYSYRKHSMTLFDEKGLAYVTGSNRCYSSLMEIVSIKRFLPSKEKPMSFKVVEVDAEQKGHKYLMLELVV